MPESDDAHPQSNPRSGSTNGAEGRELEMFGGWIDSDLKVQLLVFFHENPGVMETVDGLARRLSLNRDRLAAEIADHVDLGVLSERHLGEKTIYVYNRGIERDLAARVGTAIERHMQGGSQP